MYAPATWCTRMRIIMRNLSSLAAFKNLTRECPAGVRASRFGGVLGLLVFAAGGWLAHEVSAR
jgi:hypothetical protein